MQSSWKRVEQNQGTCLEVALAGFCTESFRRRIVWRGGEGVLMRFQSEVLSLGTATGFPFCQNLAMPLNRHLLGFSSPCGLTAPEGGQGTTREAPGWEQRKETGSPACTRDLLKTMWMEPDLGWFDLGFFDFRWYKSDTHSAETVL